MHNSNLSLISEDLERLLNKKAKLRNFIWRLITNPGFRTVVIYRLQAKAFGKKNYLLANLFFNLNSVLHGCELISGSEISGGFIIRHPFGLVIGSKVKIGMNFTVQHGVTIGEKYIDERANGEYPKIGNNVSIGSNSVVIGKVSIGDSVTIGALSLVNKSFNANCVIAGNPARIIKKY